MRQQKYFNNKKPVNPMVQNRRQADKLLDAAHKVNMILTMTVLHDKFGYGEKRLDRFTHEYKKLLEGVNEGYINAEDLNNVLWEETGRKIL